MASGLLPKSPVSSSLCDEVPHIFIPKSHLEPREFLISSAKRLLQQYLPYAIGEKRSLLICSVLYARRKGWIDLYAAQQVFCHVQRLVVLLVRRNVGLRAGLFLACVALEVAAQRGLALGAGIGLRFDVIRQVLQHLDVGHDALGLDGSAGRREVARRGQPQRSVVGAERDDGLHRTFAE